MVPILDRKTARALVDAGYMPLRRYLELFGDNDVTEDRSYRAASAQHPAYSAHAARPLRRKAKAHKAA